MKTPVRKGREERTEVEAGEGRKEKGEGETEKRGRREGLKRIPEREQSGPDHLSLH